MKQANVTPAQAACLLVCGMVTTSAALSTPRCGATNGQHEQTNYRWLVFLTNQSGLVLALHTLVEAVLVVGAYRGSTTGQSMPASYQLAWAIQVGAEDVQPCQQNNLLLSP